MALRDHLAEVKDIILVDRPVSYDLEASRLLAENNNTPIMFTDINGMRAVGNVWSTRDAICNYLRIEKDKLMERMLEAISNPSDPKLVDNAPFMEDVREDFDLTSLPIIKHYPKDAGRYITSAIAIAEQDGKANMSFHRMLLLDGRSFALRLVPRHLYTMWKNAKSKGKDLPVAFCLGLSPPELLAAATSTNYDIDEMQIASSLKERTIGSPLEVYQLPSGIRVPSQAEIVLEGRITSRMVDEGPFVDITRTYDMVRPGPVFEVDRLYMRNDPIFQLLFPGGLEHFLLMGLPREPIIYRTVNQVVPRVHGVRLTEGGCCWLHGVVSITKNKEGDGTNAAIAALTGHPSMKQVIVVDGDIDIYDDLQVEWALATRFQASRSLTVIDNAAGSSLDPSGDGTTSKIAIDATLPLGTEGFERAVL
ncbi:MAG: UbiD family decarboxylase [Euryarchaeota archaeon]|nr:UbiD family decarboxylase [Euryarchaeota archaeon]